MAILGNTTAVVMIPVLLFQMTDTCGTLLYLIIQISVATTFLKSEIHSFTLSTFLVQNTGYNQPKQILPQMLPSTKLLKVLRLIQFWTLLMIKE